MSLCAIKMQVKKLCANANTIDTNGQHHMKQQNIQMDFYELTGLICNVRIYIYIIFIKFNPLWNNIYAFGDYSASWCHTVVWEVSGIKKYFCTHRCVQKLNLGNISTVNKATKTFMVW